MTRTFAKWTLALGLLVMPVAFAQQDTKEAKDAKKNQAQGEEAGKAALKQRTFPRPGQTNSPPPNGCQMACSDRMNACIAKCGDPGEPEDKNMSDKDAQKKGPSNVDKCAADCAKNNGPCFKGCK